MMSFSAWAAAFLLGAASCLAGSWIIRHKDFFWVADDKNPGPEQSSCGRDPASLLSMGAFAGSMATGLAYVLILHLYGGVAQTFLLLTILSLLLLIARLDWQEGIVPDLFVLLLAGLGTIKLILAEGILLSALIDALIGGAASAAIMTLLMAASAWRHGHGADMGHEIAWGDVTLMFGLGFLVGAGDLPWFWLCAGLGHVVAFIVTTRGRESLRAGRALPMAPALCLACAATLMAQAGGLLPLEEW